MHTAPLDQIYTRPWDNSSAPEKINWGNREDIYSFYIITIIIIILLSLKLVEPFFEVRFRHCLQKKDQIRSDRIRSRGSPTEPHGTLLPSPRPFSCLPVNISPSTSTVTTHEFPFRIFTTDLLVRKPRIRIRYPVL